MDHTVLPAITPMPSLPCKRSLDGASSDWVGGHLIAAYYSFIYCKRMKGWVSLVGWHSRWFTHINGHPSAAGRAQDRESLPIIDRRSTTVTRISTGLERESVIIYPQLTKQWRTRSKIYKEGCQKGHLPNTANQWSPLLSTASEHCRRR